MAPVSPPETVNAEGGDGVITVTWSRVEQAEEYRVYRTTISPENTSSYSALSGWIDQPYSGDTVSYDDTDISSGVKYYYRIVARFEEIEGTLSAPAEAWTGNLEAPPDTPQNVSAEDRIYNSQNRIQVTWNPVPNAESYNIYRLASAVDADPDDTDSYILVTEGIEGTLINDSIWAEDNPIELNRMYYYRVRSVNTFGPSLFSEYDSGHTDPLTAPYQAPQTVTATEGSWSNAIIVSWENLDDAAWYQVYSYDGNPDYSPITEWITGTSFIHTSPPAGNRLYKIKARHEYGGVTELLSPAATGWTDAASPVYGSTYTVSGTILSGSAGLTGVTVTLTEGTETVGSAMTDGAGTYSISGVEDGSYTATPALEEYTFSPEQTSVSVSGSAVTGIDFTASATAAYTWTDFGTIATIAEGIAPDTLTMTVDTSTEIPYIGFIHNTGVSLERNAMVYWYDGTTWQNTGSLPQVLSGINLSYETISLTAGNGACYLSTMDESGVYIYKTSGSEWSTDLAASAFTGVDDQPVIAFSGGILYAAWIGSDDNIVVYQWDGNETSPGWTATGQPLSTSGTVWDFHFANIAGNVSAVYTEDLDGDSAYHDRLTVKHWNSLTWQTDLAWDQNYLGPVEITGNGTDIYTHIVSAYQSQFPEGVYHIESATTAVKIDENLGTESFACDTDGNLIMMSPGIETYSIPWAISIYDGISTAAVTGDYTNFEKPGTLSAVGTVIYAAHAESGSFLTNTYPTKISAVRLSP
jgi:fibronectin type 3 domain-containing protein